MQAKTNPATKPAPTPAAPPRTANQPSNPVAPLITQAVASTLNLVQLAEGMRVADAQYRGAYAAFGIYRYYTEKRLAFEKSRVQITTFLREKCGLSASTISHTSYAAKTFNLVATGHLGELEYAAMSAAEMTNLQLVIGDRAKARLVLRDAIELLRLCRREKRDAGEEFASLYEHGLTVADAEKAAKMAADKAAEEQAAKAAAEKKAAADKAVQEALAKKAAADKAKADADAAKAAEAKEKADAKAKSAKSAEEKKLAEAAQKQADADATAAAAAQAKAKDDAKAAGAPAPAAPNAAATPIAPGKIVAGPGSTGAKPTATELAELLDKLLVEVSKADAKVQAAFVSGAWNVADQLLRSTITPAKKAA
jgi:chemotaxis protein histidine kinase CheA